MKTKLNSELKDCIVSCLVTLGFMAGVGGVLTEVLGWSRWLLVLCCIAALMVDLFRPKSTEAEYNFLLMAPASLLAGTVAFVAQFFFPLLTVLVVSYAILTPIFAAAILGIILIMEERKRHEYEARIQVIS